MARFIIAVVMAMELIAIIIVVAEVETAVSNFEVSVFQVEVTSAHERTDYIPLGSRRLIHT